VFVRSALPINLELAHFTRLSFGLSRLHQTPKLKVMANRFEAVPGTPVRKIARLIFWACAAHALVGCSTVTEKISGWMASDANALAVVDGRVLRGQARFYSEREATFSLNSTEGVSLVCHGPLRFTGSKQGVIQLQCSDSRSAHLQFAALTPLSGSAAGKSSGDAGVDVMLTYGMPAQRAAAYLSLPVERLMPPKPDKPAAPAASATPAASN
jgi:hypothetical protein